MVTTVSTLTCPACGFRQTETMPDDRCVIEYRCPHCQHVVRPHPGDCCVFCSYGSVPCPAIQDQREATTRRQPDD